MFSARAAVETDPSVRRLPTPLGKVEVAPRSCKEVRGASLAEIISYGTAWQSHGGPSSSGTSSNL